MDQIEEQVGREQYEKALIFKNISPRIWQVFKYIANYVLAISHNFILQSRKEESTVKTPKW